MAATVDECHSWLSSLFTLRSFALHQIQPAAAKMTAGNRIRPPRKQKVRPTARNRNRIPRRVRSHRTTWSWRPIKGHGRRRKNRFHNRAGHGKREGTDRVLTHEHGKPANHIPLVFWPAKKIPSRVSRSRRQAGWQGRVRDIKRLMSFPWRRAASPRLDLLHRIGGRVLRRSIPTYSVRSTVLYSRR